MKLFDRKAHLARLAEAKRGKHLSEDTKRRISASMMGQGKGAKNPHWHGGSYVCKGYRYAYCPDHPHATKLGYVLEHRLVVELIIGRVLRRKEVVHHIDRNPLNNSFSNLELCASSGEHTMTHHTKRDAVSGRFLCA